MRERKEFQILKSTVASVVPVSECDTMPTTVRERHNSKASCLDLEQISTTLSNLKISLQLEKVEDQLIFQFSSSLDNWTSPVFNLDGAWMYMELSNKDVLSSKLLMISLWRNAIHGIYIELELQLGTETDKFTLLPISLCQRCIRRPYRPGNSEQVFSEVDIPPPSLLRYPTCVITLSLTLHVTVFAFKQLTCALKLVIKKNTCEQTCSKYIQLILCY